MSEIIKLFYILSYIITLLFALLDAGHPSPQVVVGTAVFSSLKQMKLSQKNLIKMIHFLLLKLVRVGIFIAIADYLLS